MRKQGRPRGRPPTAPRLQVPLPYGTGVVQQHSKVYIKQCRYLKVWCACGSARGLAGSNRPARPLYHRHPSACTRG